MVHPVFLYCYSTFVVSRKFGLPLVSFINGASIVLFIIGSLIYQIADRSIRTQVQ